MDVSAGADLLETTQSQISTTFDTQQVANLPLAGGFDELTLLVPGVVATHANNFSNTNGTGFSSNGQRGRSNNFEIDGQSNNDNSIGGPQFFFQNEEAIDQVQVITNNFSAAYGRNMGSVVNYITKSGPTGFIGSAFYRYSGNFASSSARETPRGLSLDSASLEDPSDGCNPAVVPRYVYNLYGGNGTAPIWKDKLFASGSFFGTRLYETGSTISTGVNLFPTADGLAALNTAFPNSPAVAILNQLNPLKLALGNPRATGAPVNQPVTANGTTLTIPFTQVARSVPNVTFDQEYLGSTFSASRQGSLHPSLHLSNAPTSPNNASNTTAAGGIVNVTGITHSVGADWNTNLHSWIGQCPPLWLSAEQAGLRWRRLSNLHHHEHRKLPIVRHLERGFTTLGLGSSTPRGAS